MTFQLISSAPARRSRAWLCAGAAVLALVGPALPVPATAQGTTPSGGAVPTDVFFRFAAMGRPVLSPSGRYAAMAIAGPDGDTALGIVDLQDATPRPKGVARLDRGSIIGIEWVNEDRLVFGTLDPQLGLGEQRPSGLLAVGRDGSNFRRLISSRFITEAGSMAREPLAWNHRLQRTLRDGSADIIVERFKWEDERQLASAAPGYVTTDLLRMNTETNAARVIEREPPEYAVSWVVDAKGQPRVATSVRENKATVYWKDADKGWVPIQSSALFSLLPGQFEPLAVGPDQKLYVKAAGRDAAGAMTLSTFDPATRQLREQPLVALPGFDFEGSPLFSGDGRLVGVSFLSDAPGAAWFDPQIKALQASIDKLLPHTNNLLGLRQVDAKRVLVSAESDRQPPLYFVYDRDAGKLTLIGASRPWVDPARMATRDFLRIKTRDGLEMPIHVTKPAGKGPWPLVMLVHGGPNVRGGHWAWDADSQFLASRGYLVVEPEFRGSTGFGYRHYRAGWKQWGLAMQDDVTDAARWAIAQKLADPDRVAIAGASYGGYATMMGLAKEPQLFKAGVNWVGVTDIELMYSVSWSDLGDIGRRYFLPQLVGDLEKDKAQLDATSPLKQAARIKQPVLMAYGAEDRRVPIVHGEKMRDALQKNGTPVEWIAYAEEGHGWLKASNRVDFWNRVEAFLARHLK